MRDFSRLASAEVPLSRAWQLDGICDAFEAAWQGGGTLGERPRIEAYLGDIPEPERSALLRELLLLEIEYRRKAGAQPRAADYQERFATLEPDWLAQALAAGVAPEATRTAVEAKPAATEELASDRRRFRCPHCHNPLQLADDSPDEVLCPGCGSSYRIRDARQTTTTQSMRPLGKFHLLERVGLGAFGAVWKAHDTQLGRIVALKIPHAGLLASPNDLERFHREARAAAQLRHPGIVTVHEVVMLDGLPAIVADFIDGAPLKDLLEVRRLTFREAATLLAEVADALDYAHAMGLVHRDLKPANIMLERRRPAGGTETASAVPKPLLMDFGLARWQEGEIVLTVEGQIIGTPAYMSPEQAAGQGHKADRRSDLYSLGVILYELLTGELPFRGSKAMLRQQVLYDDPRLPRRINDRIPRDLETICLKALAKEPAQRYATARALADDLRHWLAGEPIQARPVGQLERLGRWCRRNPVVAGLGAAVVLLLALVAGVSSIGYVRATRLAAAEHRAREEARRNLYVANVRLAQQAWEGARVDQMILLLEEAARCQSGDEDLRGFEWHYLWRLAHPEVQTLGEQVKHGQSVAFSPDGKCLASASEGPQGTVRLWEVATGKELRILLGHTNGVTSVVFSPDGQMLASASLDKTVRLWEVATGAELRTLKGHTDPVTSVAFSPDGQHVASASGERFQPGNGDCTVRLWEVATGKELHQLNAHPGAVLSVAFSPNGEQLASSHMASGGGYAGGAVKLWDIATGKVIHTLQGPTGFASSCVVFSPDGKRLASGWNDNTVKVCDAQTGQEIRVLKGHLNLVYSVAFSPDGQRLASGSRDRTVRIWETATGKEVRRLIRRAAVASVAFSPDGQHLAVGGGETVALWEAAIGNEIPTLQGHTSPVWRVAFSPDGQRLASSSWDKTAKIWEAATGKELLTLQGHADKVWAAAFSPDGQYLASASSDRTVKLWETASGQALRTFAGHTADVYCVAFSPDGRRLASGSYDKTVKLWDTATGQVIRTLEGHTNQVQGVAFSPDGQRLASASRDATVRIWETATGKQLFQFTGPPGSAFFEVAYSPDGQHLAAAHDFDTVWLWETTTGERPLPPFQGHNKWVFGVRFSPDGRRLASASADQTVRILWEVATGKELLTLQGHTNHVHGVAFSPDGQRLASASRDHTVRLWEATPVPPEVRRQRALRERAFDLVESLYATRWRRAEVIQALRDDRLLDAALRHEALAVAERYHPGLPKLHDESWAVVRQPGASAEVYQRALLQAEEVCQAEPNNGVYVRTLGVAQYRVGQYQAAVETFMRSEKIHGTLAAESHPTDLAFLALAQHGSGAHRQAQETLARLRQAAQQPPWVANEDAQRFLREAEKRLGGE